ncbi:MAG TPA: recombinase RecQ, partial [Galbitalea sp.]
HPMLVESVARALGEAGRLPYLGALDIAGEGARGEPGGNSAYRLSAVWSGFSVGEELAGRLPVGPILLVDDLADSRWTLTVCARLLRIAGAESVLPFALALRG